MEATYEFFKKEFEFQGKHAKMVSELWTPNDYQHTYFRRLIDIYLMAPVIGYRLDRKSPVDYSTTERNSIFSEQMLKEKENLDYIMQMILMLEYADTKTLEECVKIAFRGAESKEQYDAYYNLFNDYVRGGVEELYERLIIQKAEPNDEYVDDKTKNIMGLMDRFSQKDTKREL